MRFGSKFIMLAVRRIVLCTVLIMTSSPYYTNVNAELYTAVAGLEQLLETEEVAVRTLENYINKEKQRLRVLQSLFSPMKKQHRNAMKNRNYVTNPINGFKLIKRLYVDLKFIEGRIRDGNKYIRNDTMQYPSEEDLAGAAQGLSRIQKAYLLKVADLSNGQIFGNYSQTGEMYKEKVSPLTANDCFEIGKSLYETEDNAGALEWLMQALIKSKRNKLMEFQTTEEEIIYAITTTYRAMEDNYNTTLWQNKLFTSLECNLGLMNSYKDLMAEVTGQKPSVEDLNLQKCENVLITKYNRDALCRGVNYVSKDISKKLKCKYLRGRNPYLKLAPIKVEQLYLNPEVSMFHDVITDPEIEVFKWLGKPMLNRGRVYLDNGELKHSDLRISKTAFIPDFENNEAERLARRVEHFTGLSMETSEDFQIANYGIGGYQQSHFDYFDKPPEDLGNRYSTVLFYLSDVTQGGATVFTNLGLPVFPKKGSALYFKNMQENGDGDKGSAHAACPVLSGDKWVMTKWIRQYGQEFREPCQATQR